MNDEKDWIVLEKPGPMIPPVSAIITSVRGDDGGPDALSVLWTFVLNGSPAQVGISADVDEHVACRFLQKHKEFVLNVMTKKYVKEFDVVDMSSSKIEDKYLLSGLTRSDSTIVNAPGIEEAAIRLECKVSQYISLPPNRIVFFADVVRTEARKEVCDSRGRLIALGSDLFGMASGCGEFYTFGEKVGHIGMTKGRTDIRY